MDLGDVFCAEGSGVDGGVAGADEFEDGGAGFGGVEVVGERGAETLGKAQLRLPAVSDSLLPGTVVAVRRR